MSAPSRSTAAALLAALCLLSMLFSSPASAAGARHSGATAKTAKKHAKRTKLRKKKIARVKRTRATLNGGLIGGHQSEANGTNGTGNGSGSQNGSAGNASSVVNGPEPAFGVFTDDAPYGGNVNAVDTLAGTLGRDISIVNWYQSWGGGDWVSQVQPQVIGAVTGSGRTPLLTWEPWNPANGAEQPEYKLSKIAGGDFDAYMGAWADGLKALGTDVYLRPMHEMNGNWYPWGGTVNGNTPADYVRAWRHMHDVFVAHGATNVKWVWSPMPESAPATPGNALEKYYPGAEYVDVLALDGYNWGAGRQDMGGWKSFTQVFKGGYDKLAALGSQPIWFAEVGSSAKGGDKAAWVRDMWKTSRTWSRLKALVWFDQDKEEDWRAAPVASAFAQG